jgi:serine/threonine protein kinase
MNDESPRCAACRRALAADDRFCPRCGTPTPANLDPGATLVDAIDAGGTPEHESRGGDTDVTDPAVQPVGGDTEVTDPVVRPAGRDTEVTDPAVKAEPAARPTGSSFGARLRAVLGAEYQVLTLIGQGGFARVYRARDRRLDRIVAIKVIRPDVIGTKAFVESFRNEGVALAKLRHPGIVPIYDIRERDGLIYYIMPFVEGTTLEARLERGRLPPFESRRILSELADALAAAHRAKMVHLDIKPANIFLEGDLQKVLLMDFGIAKAITEQVEEASDGPIAGTPEYMSPEQARGLPEIDHRSDIYSLGALGYRMLLGRPPFWGKNPTEILTKHVKEAPVPVRDVNPSIPKEFADAIMRCLEKDPWRRFPTAMELRGTLDAVTFFSPRRESTAHDAPSGVQRNTMTLLVLVGFFLGLLAGLALR